MARTQWELDQERVRRNREYGARMTLLYEPEVEVGAGDSANPRATPSADLNFESERDFDIDHQAPPEDVPEWEDV